MHVRTQRVEGGAGTTEGNLVAQERQVPAPQREVSAPENKVPAPERKGSAPERKYSAPERRVRGRFRLVNAWKRLETLQPPKGPSNGPMDPHGLLANKIQDLTVTTELMKIKAGPGSTN